MKRLSLRPYHGEIWLCRSIKEIQKQYERVCQQPYPYDTDPNGGQFIKCEGDDGSVIWLIYCTRDPSVLAHEFCHVLLHTFGTLGHDPTKGDGEPFCYMLTALMREAA